MSAAKKVCVIGGGASGLICAYLLAEAGLDLMVLEKNALCGKKLSMTGNGRCNLTNLNISPACYNEEASAHAEALLERFPPERVISFFKKIGVLCRDEEGYIYPVSGDAGDVRDALVFALENAGGVIETTVQVKRVERVKADCAHTPHMYGAEHENEPGAEHAGPERACRFKIYTDKKTYEADFVVLASGGMSGPKTTMSTGDGYYMAELLGIPVTKRYPALTGLISRDVKLPEKNGVRVLASVKLTSDGHVLATEIGEVQLTNGMISGIPVMQLSRFVPPLIEKGIEVTLVLDVFPDFDDEAFEGEVEMRLKRACDFTACGGQNEVILSLDELRSLMRGFAPECINEIAAERFFATVYGAEYENEITIRATHEEFKKFLYTYRSLSFKIDAAADFTRAQATAGGIALPSLTQDMESAQVSKFFAIGEVCDADGRCGGYNLQWAFMSAMAASEKIREEACLE